MVQTRDGYLWFTTFDGLVRFDGVKFAVFNKNNTKGLASNRIQSIFAEADDTLWLSTEDSGLVRFRNGQSQTHRRAAAVLSHMVVFDAGGFRNRRGDFFAFPAARLANQIKPR